MYDHIGGGFSRYSTDVYWRIPHFEKMLYDNALIARAYLEAHQVTGKPWYAQVVHETLAYVQRDMTHADGGFFSAEDADSEGEEGKFYVFDPEDLVPVLEPKAISRMCEAFGISPRGNFEHGKSVLQLRPDLDWSVKSEALVKEALEQLLEARDKRIRPLRDDKILTSWNGLMIDTCAYAYRVLQDRRYLEAAERAARFVQAHLWTGEKLRRSWREGSSRHDGTLEDYAYLIQGLLGLYEASGVETWAEWAKQLQEIQDAEFFVPERSAYALTPADQPHLIVRTLELTDGAMPNANGVTAQNLQKLAGLFGRPSWRDRAEAVMLAGGKLLERHPEAFGSTLLAVDDWLRGGVELVAAIDPAWPDAAQPMRALQQAFLPGVTLAWVLGGTEGLPCTQGRAAGAGGPRYYLCRQFSCAAPETELERVLDQAQTL